MNKKSKKLCFFIQLFFNVIYFRSSCGKKEQNRQNNSQTSQNYFFVNLMKFHAQIFAADHIGFLKNQFRSEGNEFLDDILGLLGFYDIFYIE